jgi:hypothetical protein
MAFLFADSFDHYATADVLTKWTSTNNNGGTLSITSSAGRRSTNGFRMFSSGGNNTWGYLSKTLTTSGAGFVVGFYVTVSAAPSANGMYLATIVETATTHLILRLNADFTISVLRGDSTVLGTSSTSGLAAGVGGYIEFKGTIDNSTGTYTVRCNNNQILNATGADTQNGGTSTWNVLFIGQLYANLFNSAYTAATNIDFDDLYVLDQSGGSHDSFYGDVAVDWHPVTGAGNSTQFTPSAGSNYQNVDDTTPDGDTTTNTASAVGQKDTFALTDLIGTGGTIKCVQTVIYVKKSAAGTCTVADVIRHSGSDNDGTAVGPATAYAFQLEGHIVNPGTSAAWTEAGFNAIELGYKQVS